MTAKPARDVEPGESWAFTEHRTLQQVSKRSNGGAGRAASLRRAKQKLLARPVGRPTNSPPYQVLDPDFDDLLNWF